MNEPRGMPSSPGAASPGAAWRRGATPHGYDQPEFSPVESRRDFPRPRKRREADEERRQLRQAEAAFDGSDRPPSAEERSAASDVDGREPTGRSRLYRD